MSESQGLISIFLRTLPERFDQTKDQADSLDIEFVSNIFPDSLMLVEGSGIEGIYHPNSVL